MTFSCVLLRREARTKRSWSCAAVDEEAMITISKLAAVAAVGMLFSTAASAYPYNSADRAIGSGPMGADTRAIIGAIAGAASAPAQPRACYHRHYVNHCYYRSY